MNFMIQSWHLLKNECNWFNTYDSSTSLLHCIRKEKSYDTDVTPLSTKFMYTSLMYTKNIVHQVNVHKVQV